MLSQQQLLALYVEAATKAIHEMGGAQEFKKLPMFGSNEKRRRDEKLAA